MLKFLMCLLGTALASVPGMAIAQSLSNRTDVAGSRPQPEFDPLGLRLGAWTLAPRMKVTAGYDGNLYGTHDNARGDGFVVYTPSIHATSDWGRHWLDLSASGSFTRYLDTPKQNTNEYGIVAQGRLDLGQTKLLPTISATQTAERRGTNGTPLTLGRPSLYRSVLETLEAQHQFGRFTAGVTASHARDSFSGIKLGNGAEDGQGFRDSESWGAATRISYQTSAAASVFVSGGYAHAHGLRQPACCNRSSNRLSVLGGVALDTGLIRGELGVGYLRYDFSSMMFPDYSGITYKGTLFWYPTPFITIKLAATKSLENSGIINVGALVTNLETLNADYELMRNLLVHASLSRRQDGYREISTESRLWSGQLAADYSLNRIVALGAYGRYECRESSPSKIVRDYCAVTAGMSLEVKR